MVFVFVVAVVLIFAVVVVAAVVFADPAVNVAAVAGTVVAKVNAKAMTRAKDILSVAFTVFPPLRYSGKG